MVLDVSQPRWANLCKLPYIAHSDVCDFMISLSMDAELQTPISK